MKFLLKHNGYTRLAIFLCISLFIHLGIIFGVSWSPGGIVHSNLPVRHRLTVSLTPSPLASALLNQKSEAVGKAYTSKIADIDNGSNKPSDDKSITTAASLPTAADLRYFELAELDQQPALTQDIPDNPSELLEHLQGGEIVLRLWIDETGEVVKVDTISSTLPQPFVDSTRASFLNATFSPGRKFGNAVATVMDVAVSYAPIK